MRNAAIEIYLVGKPSVLENDLTLMTFLRWELGIRFSRSDAQRACDGFQFLLGDIAGMRDETDIDLLDVRSQISSDVFCAEAVSYCSNLL